MHFAYGVHYTSTYAGTGTLTLRSHRRLATAHVAAAVRRGCVGLQLARALGNLAVPPSPNSTYLRCDHDALTDMVTTPPPHNMGDALAYALVHVWNSEQGPVTFSDMTCARAGIVELQTAFTCHTAVTDRRTGVSRRYRLLVLVDGTVVRMDLETV